MIYICGYDALGGLRIRDKRATGATTTTTTTHSEQRCDREEEEQAVLETEHVVLGNSSCLV